MNMSPDMTTNQSVDLHSPKKSKPVTHEELPDGQGVYEWNAKIQKGLIETSLDLSKAYPMLSVSAATAEDWANMDSQLANADMGHLQTSIWIIDPAFRETAEKFARDLLTGGKVVVGVAELEGLVISVGRRHNVVGNGANLISQDQNKQLDVERSIREFHEEFGRVASLSYDKDDLDRWVRENTELTVTHQSGFLDKNGLLKITYSLEDNVHECAFDTNSFVASAEKKKSFESWKKASFSEWANALFDGKVEGKNMNKSFDDKGTVQIKVVPGVSDYGLSSKDHCGVMDHGHGLPGALNPLRGVMTQIAQHFSVDMNKKPSDLVTDFEVGMQRRATIQKVVVSNNDLSM